MANPESVSVETAKEMVRRIHPDAHAHQFDGVWNVVYGNDPYRVGYGNIGPNAPTKGRAWTRLAEALSAGTISAVSVETAKEAVKKLHNGAYLCANGAGRFWIQILEEVPYPHIKHPSVDFDSADEAWRDAYSRLATPPAVSVDMATEVVCECGHKQSGHLNGSKVCGSWHCPCVQFRLPATPPAVEGETASHPSVPLGDAYLPPLTGKLSPSERKKLVEYEKNYGDYEDSFLEISITLVERERQLLEALTKLAALQSSLGGDRYSLDGLDARRYRLIRGESIITVTPRRKGNFISFPTIPTQPTNIALAYRDNYDASVDAAMAGTLSDKSGEFNIPAPPIPVEQPKDSVKHPRHSSLKLIDWEAKEQPKGAV